ncbi:MAG: histidinol-phosphate transaminase [Ghiorsea sp.]
MSQFWSQSVHNLDPYVPGEQPKTSNLIKLNTNENPYGPSPKALSAIQDATSDSLKLYPDPNSDALKTSIAKYYNLSTNQVFVGNGSDEVLAHVFQGLLKHDEPLLFPDITYSFYPVYCGLYDINYKTIPLTDSFEINISDYQQPNGGIIFPNPNAPTGVALPLHDIEVLVQQNSNRVVVIDEAYVDFGGNSAVQLINKYPNLLVIQTLSKSRSLAGLRVGFAMGNAELIEGLERVKNSFNSYPIDRLALHGAVAAMEDVEYFEKTCKKIIHSREVLSNTLTQLGFDVLPSTANFVFAKHPTHEAANISQYLREHAIIVRHFNHDRINQYLRITVGTDAECNALTHALKDFLTAI